MRVRAAASSRARGRLSRRAQSSPTALDGSTSAVERAGARDEEIDAIVLLQRRHCIQVLALELQPLAARDEDRRSRDVAESRDLVRDSRKEMLGIVQQQERAHAAQPLGEQLVEMAAGLLFDLKGLRERRDEPARVSKRSEGGPPDPVGVELRRLGRGVQCESSLARPRGP